MVLKIHAIKVKFSLKFSEKISIFMDSSSNFLHSFFSHKKYNLNEISMNFIVAQLSSLLVCLCVLRKSVIS